MKKKTILLLFALLLFTNLSCFLFEDQETEIPAPVIIDNEPFLNTDSTYFLEWPLPPQGYTVEDAESTLEELIGEGIAPAKAWFPMSESPCEVLGAVTVAAVELEESDPRILELGYLADPLEWWEVNCAIAGLWLFTFE